MRLSAFLLPALILTTAVLAADPPRNNAKAPAKAPAKTPTKPSKAPAKAPKKVPTKPGKPGKSAPRAKPGTKPTTKPGTLPRTQPRPKTSPSTEACHQRLMEGYDAYRHFNEAVDVYKEALVHIPELLAATTAEQKERKSEFSLALSSAQTYAKMFNLELNDDKIRWRQSFMKRKADWLNTRITLTTRLMEVIPAHPELKFLENAVGGVLGGLDWLNNKRNSKAVAKKKSLPWQARRDEEQLSEWIHREQAGIKASLDELAATLCARLKG